MCFNPMVVFFLFFLHISLDDHWWALVLPYCGVRLQLFSMCFATAGWRWGSASSSVSHEYVGPTGEQTRQGQRLEGCFYGYEGLQKYDCYWENLGGAPKHEDGCLLLIPGRQGKCVCLSVCLSMSCYLSKMTDFNFSHFLQNKTTQ